MIYQIQVIEAPDPGTKAEYVYSSGEEALQKVKEICNSKSPKEFMLIGQLDEDGILMDSECIMFKEDIKPAFFI